MLCSAAALLSALNALEASTSSTASVSSDSNIYACIAWAAGLDNIIRSNTHYTLSTNSPLNFPDSYWSNSTFAFIQWNQTVSYHGHRINALWTQSPCYCGYCLTQPFRWLFKGLASEDSSETIRVNPRRASCSFCSQSSLPDHLTVYLRIHRFRILPINWPEEQWT